MPRRLTTVCLLSSVLLLAAPPVADAGPLDARVGETRAVYKKPTTNLRDQPAALGKSIAALPSGTRVRVLEIKQPQPLQTLLALPHHQMPGKQIDALEFDSRTS